MMDTGTSGRPPGVFADSIDVDNEEQDVMYPFNIDDWVSEELMGYILLRHV